MSQAAGSSSREEEPSSAEFSTLGLTPSQQTQQLAGASFTKFNPALLLCSNNSRSISARHEMTYCAALGRPVSPLRGVVTWEIRIDNSRQNQGGAMCIGVADASATFTNERGGLAYGFNPYSGSLMVTENCYRRARRPLEKIAPARAKAPPHHPAAPPMLTVAPVPRRPRSVDYQKHGMKLMTGDLQMRCSGSLVQITWDESTRSLVFCINGGQGVRVPNAFAGVAVPRVRPWVHLFKADDKVTLGTAYSGQRKDRSALRQLPTGTGTPQSGEYHGGTVDVVDGVGNVSGEHDGDVDAELLNDLPVDDDSPPTTADGDAPPPAALPSEAPAADAAAADAAAADAPAAEASAAEAPAAPTAES